jgi:hypothetical protein
MPVFKHTIVICCLLTACTVAMAQKPATPVKPKENTTVQKFKPPKLKTSLGNSTDTTITVSVDEAVHLVELPLIIMDDKKGAYTVNTYQCLYKRRAVTEDEESGKVTPTTSIVAQRFRSTPLPEIWRKIIAEQLKSGEEILFFEVIAKDAQGRFMFAPNLKLIVK